MELKASKKVPCQKSENETVKEVLTQSLAQANQLATATALQPGVYYACRRCTACCRWPGDVRIDEDDIKAMSAHLGISEDEFIARYTRLRANRHGLSLIEREDHSCIMLEGSSCLVHAVKPHQCRSFPNGWNFPGWEQWCEAEPVAVACQLQRKEHVG